MTIIQFVRLLKNHLWLLILAPIFTGLCIIVFIDDSSQSFSTSSKVYTGFASGYSIKNSARRDYYAIKTKFDNFFENTKSRSTKEEIVLKTLAYYLCLDKIASKEMSEDNQLLFKNTFTTSFSKKFLVKNNNIKTYENLLKYYRSSFDNEIYLILNAQTSDLLHLFSLEKVSGLIVTQEGTSDLVLFRYESSDPGVSYTTLTIAIEVMLSKVKLIKFAESNSVVKYFMAEVIKAQKKLDLAEKELAELMTKNNITNYYEQTKWLASRNEDFEVAYQKEKLGLAGALAAEKEAIATMGISNGIKVKTKTVTKFRKSIRLINEQILANQIKSGSLYSPSHTADSTPSATKELMAIDSLTIRLQQVENQLNIEIGELLEMKNTTSGVQLESIATKWLDAVIEVEQYKARIIQFIQFEKEFELTYARFSKLGSKIKRLERKIGVYERDYLDFVASLNDAKLIEENIQMSSSLKIIDSPFYPVNAEASKKPLIIVLGSTTTLILCIAIIVFLEFIDSTIRTPERFNALSKTELIGGFPIIGSGGMNNQITRKKLINQISNYIYLKQFELSKISEVFFVLFLSTRNKEGKSQLIHLIANSMRKNGLKVLVFYPSSEDLENLTLKSENSDNISVETSNKQGTISRDSLEKSTKKTFSDYDYIFYELPAIIGYTTPINLLKTSNLSVLISKANRIWNAADSMAINSYKKSINHPISSILNGAMVDNLESLIGEIPKSRSRLRVITKRLASLKFKRNKF
jgi:succinoglycan biosynthesis transport protein ExoP